VSCLKNDIYKPQNFAIKVIVVDLNSKCYIKKINMCSVILYFILQRSLLVFNDKKKRKSYSRYWFLTKISSMCLWKCLVICWLQQPSLFFFSFDMSVCHNCWSDLCHCSNINKPFCFIACRFKNVAPPPFPFHLYNLNFILCPGFWVLRNSIPNLT
jgi:hypothetical protein